MCGIAGFIQFKNPACDPNTLSKMTSCLQHRGPDGMGMHISDHVAFGHTRLAIIDVAGGTQPMHSQDKRYTLVFNGELYNFKKFKSSLEKTGETFSTQSDTEVLLRLLQIHGTKIIPELNGMFAFALWDQRDKKLLLARDRFGKKPLYYSILPDGIVFASELRALWKHPEISRALDPISIRHFFTYENVPAPFAATQGVKKIPPGHYFEMAGEQNKLSRYYFPSFGTSDLDETSAAKKLLDLLDQSVQRRLISDVPLGVFLSGGLDSSAIVGLMTRHLSGKDIKTFSIHFDDVSYDESLYSDEISKRFNTDHYVETLSAEKLLHIFPEVVSHLDEPFADHSILPTWLLSQHARNHVAVALGGDGADEFFAGYPTFFADRLANFFNKSPKIMTQLLGYFAKKIPVSESNMSLDFKLRQFLSGLGAKGAYRQQIWLSALNPKEATEIFSEDFLATTKTPDSFDIIQNEISALNITNPCDELLAFYQRFYLSDDLLVKTDRASMAHGLEVRAPFLDPEVTAFVNSLPFSYKLKGVTTKYLLKKTFNRKLPALITQRSKKGFGAPVAGWLRRELKPLIEEHLSYQRLKRDGIFNPEAVWGLIARHFSGQSNERKPLFALLMLHLWIDKHGISP